MTPRDSIHFQSIRVLDGGLATELERRGCDISGPLWSAHVLESDPGALTGLHLDYLRAGADCIATASYQISAFGYRLTGLASHDAARAAEQALLRSVTLAQEARAQYANESPRPIRIAASLGPWGAALHNGAEYHGCYEISFDGLVEFHAERLAVLAETNADLIAFETIPSLEEAEAVVSALERFPQLAAWISFTCRDGSHVAHGEPLRACAGMLAGVPQVVAIGINCTAPHRILPLLAEAQRGCDRKPVIVYPNSGETWDATAQRWCGESNLLHFEALTRSWFAVGAQAVGGCCRTGPAHIAAVAKAARSAVPQGAS